MDDVTGLDGPDEKELLDVFSDDWIMAFSDPLSTNCFLVSLTVKLSLDSSATNSDEAS